MNSLLRNLLIAAILLATASPDVRAQSVQSIQRLEGIWIFRALFPGQPQPVYTGTARFLADGTFSGPPNDQRSGPTVGDWTRTANREFAFTFVANTYDDAGNFRTTNRVRGMMTLGDDGLTATGRTIVDIFDAAGHIVLSRTVTFIGTRVAVEAF